MTRPRHIQRRTLSRQQLLHPLRLLTQLLHQRPERRQPRLTRFLHQEVAPQVVVHPSTLDSLDDRQSISPVRIVQCLQSLVPDRRLIVLRC
jgi:hypothetical protein